MFENRYLHEQGFMELHMFEKRLSKYFHSATNRIDKAEHSSFQRIHQNNKAIKEARDNYSLSTFE